MAYKCQIRHQDGSLQDATVNAADEEAFYKVIADHVQHNPGDSLVGGSVEKVEFNLVPIDAALLTFVGRADRLSPKDRRFYSARKPSKKKD